METKSVPEKIRVDSSLCTGCLTCALRCSFRATEAFNPAASRIQIIMQPDGMGYDIAFTDECDGCLVCVEYCPYGALTKRKDG